jgi:ABC-type molybdate transport system permease subunit
MAPLFVIGWIAGAVVSFRFFKSVFKSSGRTRFAQERTQRKYFGYSGLEGELNWWVFIGIPVPLTAILILLIEPFARTVGEKSGVAVGAIIVIFGAAMYFCDRLPQRLVFRLGIFGWVFTLAFGYWYFKTYGP